MYFDDCERRLLPEQWEVWLPESKVRISSDTGTWQSTRTEAKIKAMEQLLGYNAHSATTLSVEQIEDETLQWALEYDVIWAGDDEDDESINRNGNVQEIRLEKTITSKYRAISDLIIAQDCTNTIDALAFLWNFMAKLLENQEVNSVYMVVFPKAPALWQYDIMVTVLQALKISKPLLPKGMQNIQLDLFHPKYKNSPRMLSPQMHSPFPTLGLSIKGQLTTTSENIDSLGYSSTSFNLSLDDDDLDETRSRLEALFASIDADDRVRTQLLEESIDTKVILTECQRWAQEIERLQKNDKMMEWLVDTHTEPFHLYTRIWSAIRKLQSETENNGTNHVSSTMIVVPNLDAHTTKRLAITINAALRKLRSRIRVVDVFDTSSSSQRRAPYAMIQLSNDFNLDTTST